MTSFRLWENSEKYWHQRLFDYSDLPGHCLRKESKIQYNTVEVNRIWLIHLQPFHCIRMEAEISEVDITQSQWIKPNLHFCMVKYHKVLGSGKYPQIFLQEWIVTMTFTFTVNTFYCKSYYQTHIYSCIFTAVVNIKFSFVSILVLSLEI